MCMLSVVILSITLKVFNNKNEVHSEMICLYREPLNTKWNMQFVFIYRACILLICQGGGGQDYRSFCYRAGESTQDTRWEQAGGKPGDLLVRRHYQADVHLGPNHSVRVSKVMHAQ